MSSTEAIPCCCNNNKKQYLCCLEVTATVTCIKGTADEAGCSVNMGGQPETRTITAKIQACASSEEECSKIMPGDIWCTDGSIGGGGGGGGGGTGGCGWGGGFGDLPNITGVSSVFYPGVECTGDEANEKCASSIDSLPCQALACGPCGPYFAGCADNPCPPVPECAKKPCCTPDPPKLCCFTTIDNGCISSQYCASCNGSQTSGTGNNGIIVAEVPNCSECSSSNPQPKWVATTCCQSAVQCLLHPGFGICETECCENCQIFEGPPGTPLACDMARCLTPCDAVPPPKPLCDCPLVSFGGPCPDGFVGANYGQGAFNSAETRYTSGFVKTSSGSYELNTLLLFGYGYNNL